MRLITKVLFFLFFVLLIGACGEADLKKVVCDNASSNIAECQKDEVVDIRGNWLFKLNIDFSQCIAIQNYQNIFSVTINGSNENLKIISPFGTFDGSIDQKKLTWSGQFFDKHVEKYLSFSQVDISLKDRSLSGSGNFEVSDSIQADLQCIALFQLTGSAIIDSEIELVQPEIKAFHDHEITDQTAILRWIDRSINEDSFIVERSLSDTGGFKAITQTLANQESFKDTGLTANTTYFYRVKASNNMAESKYSAVIMLLTTDSPAQAPEAPSKLSASIVRASSLYLNWLDNSKNELGFIIERSEDMGKNYTQIFETTNDTTSIKDTELNALTEYFYRVIAFNDVGFSETSNILTITTSGLPPAAPEKLALNSKTENAIHIIWENTATNAQNLIVERRLYSANNFEVLAVLGENSQGYLDNPLSPEMSYCYRVKSSNSAGESEYSNTLCETTNPASPLAPDVPGDFTVIASKTSLNFVLTWADVSNETNYKIERSLDADIGFEQIEVLPADAQSYVDTKELNKNTIYWYRMRAVNSAGDSAFTLTQNGVSSDSPKPASNLTGMLKNNDTTDPSVALSWTNPESILSIEIQRKENPGNDFQTIATFDSATQNSYEDSNIVRGDTYYYQIIMINDIAMTSGEIIEIFIPRPPTPQNMQAIANNNGLGTNFSWQENPNILNYRVERSTSENGTYVDISGLLDNNITKFFDTELSPGIVYYYRIYAISTMGESFVQKTINTPDFPVVPEAFAVVASIFKLSAEVSWNDGLTETAYEIQYSLEINGSFNKSVSINKDASNSVIDLQNSNTNYFVRMRAINDVGFSEFSEVKEIQSAQSASVVSSINLISSIEPASVTLIWTGVENAEHYRLERSTDENSGFTIVKDLIPNTPFQHLYSDLNGLVAQEKYYYRLYSVNSVGESFLQKNIVVTQQIPVSKAPFSYGGWTVSYGRIDIFSPGSVCWSIEYSCSILTETDGFILFLVTPNAYNENLQIGYVMTIMTNQDAIGSPADWLDYYHINVSKYSTHISGICCDDGENHHKLDFTHSERRGLPAPIPQSDYPYYPNNPESPNLFQGEITGIFASEYNASTKETTVLSLADTFSIKFTYDANALKIFENFKTTEIKIAYEFVYRALYSAITSMEITSNGQSWVANRGHVSSFVEHSINNAYVDYDGTVIEYLFENYLITAYAEDSPIPNTNGNDRVFFGMDFHGSNFSGNIKKNVFPIQLERSITKPPTTADFHEMAVSVYFNGGNITRAGIVTDFKIVQVDDPLPAPTSLSATEITETSISIAWVDTASNEQNVVIERFNGMSVTPKVIATLDANTITYTDNTLNPKSRYCYLVKFNNASGESFNSNIICETTGPIIPKPLNVEISPSLDSQSVKINWLTSEDIQSYRIERALPYTEPFVDVSGNLSGNINEFVDSDVLPKTWYLYRVYAINNDGESFVLKSVNTSNFPTVPKDFNLTVNTDPNLVTLTWSAVENADYYRLERSLDSNCCFVLVEDLISKSATSYTDSNRLKISEAYNYRLYAVNAAGESLVESSINIKQKVKPDDKPPFSFDGWSVKNGIIDYSGSNFICANEKYSCVISISVNGYLQISVSPATFPQNEPYVSYIMRIFTNKDVTGTPDTLDFYHVNASIFSIPSISDGKITHSERKGLPLTVNNSNALLFQGSISGELVSQYNAETGLTNSHLPEPYTINFIYDANTSAIYTNESAIPSYSTTAYAFATHPSITSLNVSIGSDTWLGNKGYVSTYDNVIAAFINFNETIVTRYGNYYLTAYADPTSMQSGAYGEYFGIDFGWNQFSDDIEKISLPPIIEHRLANPPSASNFENMTVSIYFDGGKKKLTGDVTSFNIAPVTLSSTAPPAVPVLLDVTSESTSRLKIIWADTSSSEQNFVLERKLLPTIEEWQVVATTGRNITEYNDLSLNAGTNYCYRIKSSNFKSLSESAYSNSFCQATKSIAFIAPEVPQGFINTAGYIFSWASFSSFNEMYYEIERSKNNTDGYVRIAKIPVINSTYLESSILESNTVYWYRMRATNAAGVSDYTLPLSFTTVDNPDPIPVSNLSGTVNDDNSSITLSWINPDGNSSHVLQRKDNLTDQYLNVVKITNVTQNTYVDINLTAGITYTYRTVSVNYKGAVNSELLMITVPSVP